jgi:hypothetical protein
VAEPHYPPWGTERIARLAEVIDHDEDEGPMATGRFDGAIEAPDVAWPNGDAIASPLPLAEALRWARSRADRVSVIVDGRIFSAGWVPLLDPPLDESHGFQHRRVAGWEFLDRTDADEAISWDVVVNVDTLRAAEIATAGRVTPLGRRWKTAIEGLRTCGLLDMRTTGSDGRISERPFQSGGRDLVARTWAATTPAVLLRLNARTHHAASRAGIADSAEAARVAGWDPLPEFSVDGVYATGSRPAGSNAHL